MSRAAPPIADVAILARQIEATSEMERLRALNADFAAASPDTIEAILSEAAKLASGRLDPLNDAGEIDPPAIRDGRVHMNALHRAAWIEFAEGGWIALDLPVEDGGQGLPLVLASAVQEIFDRSCPAFGMLPVSTRSAAKLVSRWAAPATKAEWLPRLVTGQWTATICISEVEAGSDAARIRTIALPQPDGSWRITGEKQWISFGDHDLSERIGHCLLARTPDAKGLSLFLVPDSIDGERNGIAVRRIEEKLGLHSSPTCALGFEDARGVLLGEEGRGLAQMFVMITNMRMSVGAMGLGIASGAADVALAYAQERKQGGRGPVAMPIIEHADVQRQLLSMHARVELMRGFLYFAATHADLGRCENDAQAREDSAALTQWLLPIVKTLGGETGFDVASDAVQVLGGAGYTREWPVEQAIRDARVLPIFEGTTGMQATDLLHRRLWKDKRQGLDVFLRIARTDMSRLGGTHAKEAIGCIDLLESTADRLMAMEASPLDGDAGATAFLDLAGMSALALIAARLAILPPADPAARRLAAVAGFWLDGLTARAAVSAQAALRGAASLGAIDALLPVTTI